MSSGSTAMLMSFDKFVCHNYNKLHTHALCVTRNEEDASDLLHDCYLKIKERIIRSGFTTVQFLTYYCISISNTYYANRKAKKNRISKVDVEECYGDLEQQHLRDSEDWQELEEHYQQSEKLTKEIFEFLSKRYDEKQIFVFTVYYLMTESRMTYQKISNQTGLSISYCSQTIKLIKKDLKENLFKFIKQQQDAERNIREIRNN